MKIEDCDCSSRTESNGAKAVASSLEIESLCIHGNEHTYDHTGAISVPIFQSATFAHPAVGQSTGFDYSRLQNPTREALEQTVAGLENGLDALAFSTGMAAVTMLMELFSPGITSSRAATSTAARAVCLIMCRSKTGLRLRLSTRALSTRWHPPFSQTRKQSFSKRRPTR